MVLTLALPLAAYSLVAGAQTTPKGKGAAAASAAPAASASAAPPADTSASAAPAASTAPATGGAGTPAPVMVDMNSKPADQAMNGATYSVRLRDLEQRVDELKDQVRRSHTRLALLSDTILGGGTSGSRAEVQFDNEMSSAFQLVKAVFVVDGQVQYSRADETGALSDQKEIPIYTGNLPPGDHTIQLELTFQGNGYGVFSYLKGYKFGVKSGHAFTVGEGKALVVTALAYEKGGATTPLEQRPTIEWREKTAPLGSVPAPAAAAASAPASSSAPGGGKK
jgi:nucleoid-associated protein YgaU